GIIIEGFKKRKQRNLMKDTATEDIESVSMGNSELKGKAIPVDDNSQSPFGKEKCALAEWKIEEWEESGDTSTWEKRAKGVEPSEFYLDDGTGEILVRVEDPVEDRERVHDEDNTTVEIEGNDEPVVEVGSEDEPPSHIAEFIRENDRVPESRDPVVSALDTGHQHGDRRYYERLIEPHEEVYVYGYVQPREGQEASSVNPENAVVFNFGQAGRRTYRKKKVGDVEATCGRVTSLARFRRYGVLREQSLLDFLTLGQVRKFRKSPSSRKFLIPE
ncbi:MAG: hypothetical protein SV760_07275, partial [Halobacteria archaeon]|nr:hypothetical protein [Halobacteria archaeon]